jgi:predicted metal-dependent hydrolase
LSLTVRKLSIDLKSGFARHWFGGDAFRTQLFNATSMTFPQGEQFFIDSVRDALPQIQSAALREAVRGFIGQEATHRHLHAQYNAELERQGLRYVLQRWIAWRIAQSRKVSLTSRLAVTAAFEHYTALFAKVTLDGRVGIERADALPRLLWSWHSAEELEHKAVAFDVYTALGGGSLRRIAWFLYVSLLFTIDLTVQTTHNLYRDGQLLRWRTWASALSYHFGRRGLMWVLVPHVLAYCAPRFHPNRSDDAGQAQAWLARHRDSYVELKD